MPDHDHHPNHTVITVYRPVCGTEEKEEENDGRRIHFNIVCECARC